MPRHIARDYRSLGVFAWALGTLVGCAAEPRQPPLDQTFRCIQVHEAGIERDRALATQPAIQCAEVCAAAAEAVVRDARLCELAVRSADKDALARCELARRNTGAITASAKERCACGR